jgi:hypothetical protein
MCRDGGHEGAEYFSIFDPDPNYRAGSVGSATEADSWRKFDLDTCYTTLV